MEKGKADLLIDTKSTDQKMGNWMKKIHADLLAAIRLGSGQLKKIH